MYKYFAFISYSSKDIAWGKRVQKKLEGYRMPSTLCSEHGWSRNPMKPIFFAPTDIQPGELTAELQERLNSSRNLIVVCSPNSAKSDWVGKEIEYFHSLGRTDHIYFFIVDGLPHSGNEYTECFNPVLETLGLPDILGANIHEKISFWPWINKERAYVQLITKLLGVEFDSVWQRHKRMMIQQVVTWCLGIIFFIITLIGLWYNTKPVDISMNLREISAHNDSLPPLRNAVLTLTIDNETKSDIIASINKNVQFVNIPHSALGKEAHITVVCKNWLTTDTIVTLSKDITLDVSRDPRPYGDIQFRLWNVVEERTYPNTSVTISGHYVKSDIDGMVKYTMPLADQNTKYEVKTTIQLENEILYMPTTENTIIEVK